MKISLVTTCKNRLADLEQTLPRIAASGFEEVILVDYGCPQNAGEWVARTYPAVKVVRYNDDSGFNASRARNLGAQVATGDWFFFIDCDVLIEPGFASYLRNQLSKCHYYRAKEERPRKRVAYGSFVVHRDDFMRVRGFDEVYNGWGCEDDDIFFRLDTNGTRLSEFPSEFLFEIETPDHKRTEYSPIKSRAIQHAINSIYFTVKKQVLLLAEFPGDLPIDTKEEIYKSVLKEKERLLHFSASSRAQLTIPIKFSPRPLRTVRPLRAFQGVELTITITI